MSDFATRNLATAFLAGPWTDAEMVQRGARACGHRERWLKRLVKRLLKICAAPPPADWLTDWIDHELERLGAGASLREVFWTTPAMASSPWPVPPLASVGALADWLGVRPRQLLWFADCQGRERHAREIALRHYHYRWIPRRSGRYRLLEAPKHRLKTMQRKVLHEILDQVPAHDAVHGFRKGRSIVSQAAMHVGQALVLRLDLREFFASIPRGRVTAIFRTLGYPNPVARLLAGLCTNVTPDEVCSSMPACEYREPDPAFGERLRVPHLPQGAPTSPALANLCAYRLDVRLTALADSAGARYTRYADDLTFSGGPGFAGSARRFHVAAAAIALEEGFEVNTRKTRFQRQSGRQEIAGVVVNAHPNIRREEFDLLKAILHRCVHSGAACQNRDNVPDFRGHLAGRIAHVARINPQRGARLWEQFRRIAW